MVFKNGDDCGNNHGNRRTKLKFKCNKQNRKSEIVSTQEIKVCEYEITIQTPLVCSNETISVNGQAAVSAQTMMHVYPYLNESLKAEWDQLFTSLKFERITQEIYDSNLTELFIKAGFKRSDSELQELAIKPGDEIKDTNSNKNNNKEVNAEKTGYVGSASSAASSAADTIRNLTEQLTICNRENELIKTQLRYLALNDNRAQAKIIKNQ
jgi:hypothetical protein